MNKILATILSAAALATAGNSAAAQQPAIDMPVMVHEFGNVPEDGGPVQCSFTFTNTGDAPLVIVAANASCGCTLPKIPSRPIAPGKSDSIQVTYLPAGRPGEFDKTVRVRTNIPGARPLSLKIRGVVIPPSH